MKTQAIFVLLLAVSFATEDIFAELKDSDFGKTIAKTIELNLKTHTEDGVDHTVNMLKDVRKGFRNDQEELGDAYGVVADGCRAEMTNMDRREDKLEATVTKNDRLVMVDAPVLTDRTAEKASREAELAAREGALAALGDENERQQAMFVDNVAQHNAVRSMMHQARSIMQEAFSGDGEFLQVKTSMMSRLASHIRSFKTEENTLSHGYAQIFNVIAMIAERSQEVANDGMLNTLMRIFDDIEENLETSLAIAREAERQRLEAFAELKGRLNGEIAGLVTRIAQLGGEMLALQLSLSEYESAKESAENQLAELAVLRGNKQSFCSAEDAAYQYANNELQYQVTTIGNAIYLLEDKRELLERFRG